MLKVHHGVKLQFTLDLLNLLGIRLEDIVHVVSSIKVAGIVGKLVAA